MQFENEFVKCTVDIVDNCRKIKISGMIPNRNNYKNVLLIAPNPATKMSSYSGTGLPYPCADIAFESSENMYIIDESGVINTIFWYPNSYYTVANKKKIISSIFFIFETIDGNKEFVRFELKDLYPLRTLVNRDSRTGPEFYDAKHHILPVDTAEVIMKKYAELKLNLDLA
jgi:hypothetical protein